MEKIRLEFHPEINQSVHSKMMSQVFIWKKRYNISLSYKFGILFQICCGGLGVGKLKVFKISRHSMGQTHEGNFENYVASAAADFVPRRDVRQLRPLRCCL